MRAPIIKKEDKLQYEGEILDDVRVDYYAHKGDTCGAGGGIAKILTEPIRKELDYPINSVEYNRGMKKEIFTATVQMEC